VIAYGLVTGATTGIMGVAVTFSILAHSSGTTFMQEAATEVVALGAGIIGMLQDMNLYKVQFREGSNSLILDARGSKAVYRKAQKYIDAYIRQKNAYIPA
jgi:hypothetical protein